MRLMNSVKRFTIEIIRIKEKLVNRLLLWTMYNDSKVVDIIERIICHGRKKVAFYGRCHENFYYYTLNQCKTFKKKYIYVRIGQVGLPSSKLKNKYFNNVNIWKKMDVIIYNLGISIDEDTIGFEEIRRSLSDKTRCIALTNAAFKGYFPQHTDKIFKNESLLFRGDKNLNKLIEAGQHTEIKKLENLDYYSKESVNAFFDSNVEKVKIYEKKCDIKIADYIEKYGKHRILYYSMTHCVEDVMIELTARIMVALGLDAKELSEINLEFAPKYNTHMEAVYPSVCEGLGISLKTLDTWWIVPGESERFLFGDYIEYYYNLGRKMIM